ncbi:MFS transporter [Pseudomonas sp. OF001]|jgi:hypothetical protein|uniref:MFS transporter n=1 Tax=unclassified Pseudomonas TaxID=196821 RepID=UPI0010A673E4|nr:MULTISPECIES: MFS transporter [unclassified Pseudomonas]THG79155.1 MFS transporter [Pseudomonas sp. A-1]WPP44337.1 MFS transporter [Pseudomonas sp. AN-1]CAD5376307.1 MFS transporter [Pseudomonas sp. OF001]
MSAVALQRPAFARRWWGMLALAWLPLILLGAFGPERALLPDSLAMPLFVAALLSMFVGLPLFRRFKHGLIATARALDTPDEDAAWAVFARTQRHGLLGALLPAWIAAVGRLADLHAVPVLLLAFASLVIALLYRLPRQLG